MRSLAETLAGILPPCSLNITKAGTLWPSAHAARQTKTPCQGTSGVGDAHGAFADRVLSPAGWVIHSDHRLVHIGDVIQGVAVAPLAASENS